MCVCVCVRVKLEADEVQLVEGRKLNRDSWGRRRSVKEALVKRVPVGYVFSQNDLQQRNTWTLVQRHNRDALFFKNRLLLLLDVWTSQDLNTLLP